MSDNRTSLVEKANSEYAEGYAGKTALVEFVSADPNNPITAGNARGGVIGDAVAGILEALGSSVTREYYINDALNASRMLLFGRSLETRYLQELGHEPEMPEDGYQGDYVVQLAKRIAERDGDRHIHLSHDERTILFTRLGEQGMLARQREDLQAFGIRFDNWFSERELYQAGKVEEALSMLKERGMAYESDGALWLKSTEYGDELDRALIRDNGQPTYIASDTAYHADKFARGFDRLINVWGPQHRRYVARSKAAVAALGQEPDHLDILVHGEVQVFSGGQMVTMSRRGELILLRELLDEIGKDASRFFLLSRPVGEPIELDLEFVTQETPENPLHSIRQALRRMDAMLDEADEGEFAGDLRPEHPAEKRLAELCAGWPHVLRKAADSLEPYLVWVFTTQVAEALHRFYEECRIFGGDTDITRTRLALIRTARDTLSGAMSTLGI